MEKPKVLIRRCAEYDPDKIAGIIKEGMEELGVTPEGRVLLKPNVVRAHPQFFTHAFTRKEFLDGVLAATKARAGQMKELAVGERSGITIPTRFDFKRTEDDAHADPLRLRGYCHGDQFLRRGYGGLPHGPRRP
jgi:uncharacterized protein (DUF362 family)